MSRRTIRRLVELQRLLATLFDPAITITLRRRLALERRACRLFDVLHDELAVVRDDIKRIASRTRGG